MKQKIGMAAIAKSQDPYLNDIPLSKWDDAMPLTFAPLVLQSQLRKNGDFLSLATIVCILKEAARQLKPQAERELAQT